jgi:hypothetical protein
MSAAASAGEKRSLEAVSDEPAKTSHEKRRMDVCARCCCNKDLAVWDVRTIGGNARVSLCSRCAAWKPCNRQLFVLAGLDSTTGLPRLVSLQERTRDQPLGLFQDRSPFSNCSACNSTFDVDRCKPLQYDAERGWKHDIAASVDLCRFCRLCSKCSHSAIGVPFDAATRACFRCAYWCTHCNIVCERGHFQKAFQPNSLPLCAKLCCSCQVNDAEVRHPETDRGYCRPCAVNDRYWSTDEDEEDYPEDRSGWNTMLKQLGIERDK